jgi:predicted lactoylglutathione lyase
MTTTAFITLPVSDLDRSKRFYTGLGWSLHPVFSDAGAVLISDTVHVMVLSEDRHHHLVGPERPGSGAGSSVVNALGVDRPEQVDAIVDKALAAGATEVDAQDYGFLRSRSFRDPDGHLWEILWVEPATTPDRPAPRSSAAPTTGPGR